MQDYAYITNSQIVDYAPVTDPPLALEVTLHIGE